MVVGMAAGAAVASAGVSLDVACSKFTESLQIVLAAHAEGGEALSRGGRRWL